MPNLTINPFLSGAGGGGEHFSTPNGGQLFVGNCLNQLDVCVGEDKACDSQSAAKVALLVRVR